MKNQGNTTPSILTNFLEGIRELLDVKSPKPGNPDLANRREVYGHVADFIAQRLDSPTAATLGAVHQLVGEQDQALLNEAEPFEPACLEQARTVILAIRVRYQFFNKAQAQRTTVINFLDGDRPGERSIKEVVGWESLPNDVRTERLRHAAAEVAFQLFPRDDFANP